MLGFIMHLPGVVIAYAHHMADLMLGLGECGRWRQTETREDPIIPHAFLVGTGTHGIWQN